MQKHRKDAGSFEKSGFGWNEEKPQYGPDGFMTPIDKLFMMNLEQNEFAGFSFINPEYIQHV